MTPYAQLASGTYASISAVSSTIPHTWANTDYVEIAITYESAS
jgi:hypothetical protein